MYICLRSLSLHPTDKIKFLDLNGTYIPHIRQLQISAAYVCVTIEHWNLWFTVLLAKIQQSFLAYFTVNTVVVYRLVELNFNTKGHKVEISLKHT
jgi:beta-lactamase regulating signal transducer with metallopeptidase domain